MDLTTDPGDPSMQDLRLIGVHEDGAHLILGDDGGNRYRVPLDEPLRAAVRRDRPRLGQLQIEMDGGLRPKDVQAMIRGGLTAEETSERAGWTVEKVRRYEGPILAEREHVAMLGRQVRLRSAGGGPSAGLLGSRVDERLRSRQIDSSTARWDSRRDHKGRWTVIVFFNAGGRQRQAEWSFDLLARTVQALDDEARWLSADEDVEPAGPIPAPHLRDARPSEVYDVEAEGGLDAPDRRRRDGESIDLMAAMRERSARRGRRRRPRATDAPGIDAAPDEALPLTPLAVSLEEAGDPPAAHPHPEDDPDAVFAEPAEEDRRGELTGGDDDLPETAASAPDSLAAAEAEDAPDPSPQREATPDPARSRDPEPEATPEPVATRNGSQRPLTEVATKDLPTASGNDSDQVAAPEPRRPGPAQKRPAARKSGRPSVPSWDDIMFGKKPD
ncbi:MAG: septation protein SepH [Intrasporangium sp.]|uniref:septation protein SepH n=1 Tax=Intrasporangium sp. TaxID=1925024 RepID=UPI003F7D97DB